MIPSPSRSAAGALLVVCILSGCSSTPSGYQLVKPTTIDQAIGEIPESQLLDVGVVVSQVSPLRAGEMKELGTNEDVRSSERHFVPYHLKNTLQSSSHWGAVHVVPAESEAVDLLVTSELVKSNGEVLQLKVRAVDAVGRQWLERSYHAPAASDYYNGTSKGDHEAFQDMYNTVANDLAVFKRSLTPGQAEEIRTVAKLKFARALAPEAYGEYLVEDSTGQLIIQHLPADGDPHMERIETTRERENMFFDTLNQYYEGFYINMWDAYENWRRYNFAELAARRELEQQAFVQTLVGVAMIAGAVLLQVGDVSDTGELSGILVLAGGQIMVGGINISQQASIHSAAIEELAESFGAEMKPTVLELEGHQYELTGTVSEQYEQWKLLLRRIYLEETGFDADVDLYGEEPAPATPADL